MIQRERLDIEDIQTGPRDLLLPEDSDERVLNHERATRGIDEERGGLHARKVFVTDHSDGALGEDHVDGDNVAGLEQLLLRSDEVDSLSLGALACQIWGPASDAHPKRLCYLLHASLRIYTGGTQVIQRACSLWRWRRRDYPLRPAQAYVPPVQGERASATAALRPSRFRPRL